MIELIKKEGVKNGKGMASLFRREFSEAIL